MPGLRLSSLFKLGVCFAGLVFTLHYLASSFEQRARVSAEELNWGERLGLDHYADWEQGVTNKLGDGVERIKGGLGAITGGFGWGASGTKLGSLYELVSTSNPTAYYDKRTLFDRTQLASTRVLGHGHNEHDQSSDSTVAAYDSSNHPKTQRHILVTGGFGSLGKFIVRDLILGLSAKEGLAATALPDGGADWLTHAGNEDVLVTLLDANDRTQELDFLLQNAPGAMTGPMGTDPRAAAFASSERSVASLVRGGRLRVVKGDVRDKQLMAKVLSVDGTITRRPASKGHLEETVTIPPVSGVIHLAGYSPSKCRVNPRDCEDVEREGMSSILLALERKGEDKAATKVHEAVAAERPWLVMPRRADIWTKDGEASGRAYTDSIPSAHELLKAFTRRHPLHSLLIQLPSSYSIIGDPFASRFDPFPHVVQSALGNLPIQVETATAVLDPFLSVVDATRSVIQGARMLELGSQKKYLNLLGFVAEIEVVGPKMDGRDGPVAELVRTVISQVNSHSAVSDQLSVSQAEMSARKPGNAKREAARKLTTRVLGSTPARTAAGALKGYIEALLLRQATHLAAKVNVACSSAPSAAVLEEGVMALGGCDVQLLSLIDDSFYSLACSAGLGGTHEEPLVLTPAVPFNEGVRTVHVTAERGKGGTVDLQLKCPSVSPTGELGPLETVVWADTADGGQFALSSTRGVEVIAEWFAVNFAQRDARAFTLTLPPIEGVPAAEDPKRRLTMHLPLTPDGALKFRTTTAEAPAMLFKVNPICCAASTARKHVWDFFKEDPLLSSQVTYPSKDGSTSLEHSTLALERCKDLRAEHDRILALQEIFKRPSSAKLCDPNRGEAATWSANDFATCSIDCSAPLVCLASNRCKCTRDRCGNNKSISPFPAVAYTDKISFEPKPDQAGEGMMRKRHLGFTAKAKRAPTPKEPVTAELTLEQKVAALPWSALILPGARSAFTLKFESLPAVHVVDLPKSIDNHLERPSCWKIDSEGVPLMGDHYLIEALRNVSVPIEDSDFAVVPFFQGCYFNQQPATSPARKLSETWAYAESRLAGADQIVGSRIVVPFTHDYGSCVGWWPKLDEALAHKVPSPMDQALAWQVNGDYNTRCVKPELDVVVPAITKHTDILFGAFEDLANVKPARERDHLAFFSGTLRGFGALVRTKIGCGRTSDGEGFGSSSKVLYQQLSPGQKYLGTLNNVKFALLPRGIPAWTTRVFEAIYAGAVPVFLVDRNIFPYQDIFDYSLFSVTIPENEAHRVEEILAGYGEDEVERMQLALLKVRDAFLFKLGGEEWTRKGPTWLGMVSMSMRIGLGYPQIGSCLAYAG